MKPDIVHRLRNPLFKMDCTGAWLADDSVPADMAEAAGIIEKLRAIAGKLAFGETFDLALEAGVFSQVSPLSRAE